jgi:phage gp36-like protein
LATRYAERADLAKYSLPAAVLAAIATADQDSALDAASQVADGYLGAKFVLPLTAWGEDLKRAVCDFAAWILIKRRGFSPQNADGGMIREAYDDSVEWFKGVAAGKVVPSSVRDSEPSGANNTTTGQIDTPFIVSPNQSGQVRSDDFWRDNNGDLSVGPSRRRGW